MKLARADYVFLLALAVIIIGVIVGSGWLMLIGIVVALVLFARGVYTVMTRKSSQLKTETARHKPKPKS